MQSPPETLEFGAQRLVSAPEALWLERRGGGRTWVRTRAISYDEIRAVYRYEVRDWAYLGVASAYWCGAIILLLVVMAFVPMDWTLQVGLLLLLTAGAGGWGAYRVFTQPRKLLKIDAFSGALQVPDRSPMFFSSLAGRLPKPGQVPAAPAYQPPLSTAYGAVPAPPAAYTPPPEYAAAPSPVPPLPVEVVPPASPLEPEPGREGA